MLFVGASRIWPLIRPFSQVQLNRPDIAPSGTTGTAVSQAPLAAFSLVTAFAFHSGAINVPNFPPEANGLLTVFNGLMMMKNVAIAGGFLVLGAFGPGALSVDKRGA